MTIDSARFAAIRAECANVIAAFAIHVDHREFDKAVALFAPDGKFIRPDLQAEGREEIAKIWVDRPESVVTKHMLTPTFFTEIEADSAASVTPFTLYQTEWDGEGLPKFGQPVAIAEFHDRFIRTEEGWRIAERRGVPVLLQAG